MTIRQIYEMIKAEGDQFLDAELNINVHAGGTHVGHAAPARDLWGFPRMPAYPSTGEPARIAMDVYLQDDLTLVKRRKR